MTGFRMKPAKRRAGLLFPALLLIASALVSPVSLSAQEDILYWEYPREISEGDVRFPQMVALPDSLVLVWQEFQEADDPLPGSTISLRARFSPDGIDWSESPVTIAEDIPYFWQEEVPLFSAAADADGRLVVAVNRGPEGLPIPGASTSDESREGVLIFRQDSRSFDEVAIIPASGDAADTNVAPRLFRAANDELVLFLTRRTSISYGSSSLNTLTIYASYSPNSRDWSTPELFIDPDTDLALTGNTDGLSADQIARGPLMVYNFQPFLFSRGNTDYVAFQTRREGASRVYQIYTKTRQAGGNWNAAVPVTEAITPNTGDSALEDPLLWDNQRPHLGLSAEGELLLSFERRLGRDLSNWAVIVLDENGRPAEDRLDVSFGDTDRASLVRSLTIGDSTYLLWFSSQSGISLRKRSSSFEYEDEASRLDDERQVASDARSSRLPGYVQFRGETFIYWQDRSAGRGRTILLSPDLTAETPSVSIKYGPATLVSTRPWNFTSLSVEWEKIREDSSGIAGHSWIWSKDPRKMPFRSTNTDMGYLPDTSGRSVAVDIIEYAEGEDPDGIWYFTIIARDEAGNWSEPVRVEYELDTKPPPPPLVTNPPVDETGYLVSNDISFSWKDAESEPAESYRWRLDYLGSLLDLENGLINLSFADAISFNDPATILPDPIVALRQADFAQSAETDAAWENLDNGVWAFSVASRDRADNVGLSSTTIVLARNYRAVTRITGVTSRMDAAEATILSITGRGFADGGLLTHGIIDRDRTVNRDGTWDYEYTREQGKLTVYSDIRAEISGIEGIEEGYYYIGVRHPSRGEIFWTRQMQILAGGNVKFGPFGLYKYETLWKPATRLLRISGNELLMVVIGLMVILSVLLAVTRLSAIFREVRRLEGNARAILDREPLSAADRKKAVAKLRSEGMKLRGKFMLWFTGLVLITISIISVLLGFVWIRMERDTLAEGLENESVLMLETLTTAASTAISSSQLTTINLLPDRIEALDDARWTIITGPRGDYDQGVVTASSEGYEYVWTATDVNDELNKLDMNVLDRIELPRTLSPTEMASIEASADEQDIDIFLETYVLQSDGSAELDELLAIEHQATVSAILRRVNLLPRDIGQGQFRVLDEISNDIETMRRRVEAEIVDGDIDQMLNELAELDRRTQGRAVELLNQVILTGADPETVFLQDQDYQDLIAARQAQNREIETLFLEVSNRNLDTYPEFSSDSLRSPDVDEIIFYKPILYLSSAGNNNVNYFRGTVRLAVTIEGVRNELADIQLRIIYITIISAAISLLLGLGASLGIANAVVRPITNLVNKVEEIQTTVDKTALFDFRTGIKSKDELGTLGGSIDEMAFGLAERAKEQKELIAGQEIQKTFLTLNEGRNKKGDSVKLSTGGDENTFFRLFGYYEGADAVSGDYFGYRSLDEDHRVLIKLDIAGHGVTAAMIMVQVASLFVDYFRRVRDKVENGGRLEYNLSEFVYSVNDLMNEVDFRDRFAAFNISVINVRTGNYEMIHAGDNQANIYNKKTGEFRHIELVEAPAAGMFESFMIEAKNTKLEMDNPGSPLMYESVRGKLDRGEIMFLYTDGIEEAHHLLRDEHCKEVRYSYFSDEMKEYDDDKFVANGYKTIFDKEIVEASVSSGPGAPPSETRQETEEDKDKKDPRWEEFDLVRIDDVIKAAMQQTEYVLERRLDLTISKPLHFDFTTLTSDCESAVLALASVERVFRLVPDPEAGPNARIKVDRKIDDFLKAHLKEYNEFFAHPVEEESDVDYVWFSHLESDPQDDDLTLWAFERL